MDTQGRRQHVDPADQWVFDPETGSYQLRLEPPQQPEASVPAQGTGRRTQPVRQQGGSRARQGRSGAGSEGRRAPGGRSAEGGRAAGAGRAAGNGRPAGSARPAAGGRAGARGEGRGRAAARTSRRRPKARTSAGKRALIWTAGTLGVVVIAACLGVYTLYQQLNGNINTIDPGIGSKNATSTGPVDILVIGTDSRKGLKGKYGDSANVGHADTTILFHVAKDRSNATALSIPRDIITDIPDCPTKQPDGSTKIIPGESDVRFNTSLGQYGRDPGCTMRTVKALTGITPDHFMMANFDAVKDLSTAVGGVEVCLAKNIDDPDSHLKLSKGRHTVAGEQALAFVRTRHSVGFGGDLSRIELQQQFLGSMVRTMKSGDTLTSPTKLIKLADTATKALTVDTGIGSVPRLSELAKDLSRVDTRNITFTTVPVVDNPAEKVHATVVLDETRAPQLFAMVKDDISLTEVKRKQASEAARLKGPKADPVDVRVEVLNGSGIFGAAQDTVNWLQNDEGVSRSTNGGNAPAEMTKTTLEYAPNQADQARRLADMMGLPAAALRQGTKDAAPRANMTLTLGKDFTRAGTPIAAPTMAPEGIQKVKADDESVCAK
ncbi:LCP family protein [Streptomyces sp. ME01-24h]|nr:LCP family protein [Streptomyces sp. ME19-03-3]MDX3356050.1 LCP family protein [Streptomyces sp. ME01-24h]